MGEHLVIEVKGKELASQWLLTAVSFAWVAVAGWPGEEGGWWESQG